MQWRLIDMNRISQRSIVTLLKYFCPMHSLARHLWATFLCVWNQRNLEKDLHADCPTKPLCLLWGDESVPAQWQNISECASNNVAHVAVTTGRSGPSFIKPCFWEDLTLCFLVRQEFPNRVNSVVCCFLIREAFPKKRKCKFIYFETFLPRYQNYV